MMQLKPFKSRNEVFGKTIYDPNTFKHSFMSNKEFAVFKTHHNVEELNNIPFFGIPSILYSPIRVFFDLTLSCNLKCITCLNDSDRPLDDELRVEECMNVIEGLKRDFVFDVRFSGGEPTLKRGWDQILKKSKEEGLTVTLNTNGIYNKKTIDSLINTMPDEITISIDGYKEHNDYIRGEGAFDAAVNSIRILKSAGCRVTINTVVTSILDEDDIKGLLEIAADFCDDISFFQARPIGRISKTKGLLLNYGGLAELMAKIENIKEGYPSLNVRIWGNSLDSNSISQSKSERFNLMEGGVDGFTRFNIMSNGDLYAGGCALYVDQASKDELRLGNIIQENYSLLKVWRFSEKLKEIRKLSSNLKERCDNCGDYQTRCQGFTLETELYKKKNPGGIIYCRRPGD